MLHHFTAQRKASGVKLLSMGISSLFIFLLISLSAFGYIEARITTPEVEVDPIANPRIDSLNATLIADYYNKSEVFNKTETNSTGFIGLICSNGQIMRWSGAGWLCGTDSSGLSSIFSGNPFAYITGGDTVNINISAINDSIKVWDDEYLNNVMSAGRLWGGIIVSNGDGTVNISAGEGLIKTDGDSLTCTGGEVFECVPTSINEGQGSFIHKVSWGNISNFPLVGDGYNLIFWNSNTSTFHASLRENFYSEFNFVTDFTIGRIYTDEFDTVIRLCGMNIWNFNRRVQMFGEERFPVERTTGLMIGSSNRHITITSGVIWAELVNRFSLFNEGNYDSSTTNFSTWHLNSTSGWVKTTGISTIPDTYNDLDGTLKTLGVNRYGVFWVFVVHDNTVHVVYDRGSYTLGNAETKQIPALLPDIVTAYGTLVGKIIVQRGQPDTYSTQSPFITSFVQTSINNHNDLSGLQGGTSNEYYHLTSAQLTVVSNTNGTNTGDQDLSGYAELTGADFTGNVKAEGYKSADGSEGITETIDLTTASSLQIKNGLIVGWS